MAHISQEFLVTSGLSLPIGAITIGDDQSCRKGSKAPESGVCWVSIPRIIVTVLRRYFGFDYLDS